MLLVCASCAPSDLPLTLAAPALIGGTPDTVHSAVVSVQTRPGVTRGELCTGTLIAPRAVLTAGHCTAGHAPDELSVGVGPSAGRPDLVLEVSEVHTYPLYLGEDGDLQQGRDLGLLLLTRDAPVPPIAPGRSGGSPAPGDAVVLVGFGQSAAADVQTRGNRRLVETSVTAACDRALTFGTAAATACHGDSGGAVLSLSGGSEHLVGIISGGLGRSGDCTPPTFGPLTEPYLQWMGSVIAGTPDDTCARTCPPPSGSCGPPSDAGVDGAVESRRPAAGCATGQVTPCAGLWIGLLWVRRRRAIARGIGRLVRAGQS